MKKIIGIGCAIIGILAAAGGVVIYLQRKREEQHPILLDDEQWLMLLEDERYGKQICSALKNYLRQLDF